MITLGEVIEIQKILIEKYGGLHGIRDLGLLESAIARPFQKFEGKMLYPTLFDQAAALIESLVKNHPFLDGNKRIGYTIMRLYLKMNLHDISATENEKFDFVIKISEGMYSFDQIRKWIIDKKCKA